MKKFLTLLFLLFASYQAKTQCLNADIMILIDWSGSEQGNETKLVTAAGLFVSEMDISEQQIRAGVMTFSYDPIGIVDLTSNKDYLLNGIGNLLLDNADGGTEIDNALKESGQILNNKRYVRKIIIIISDGDIDDIDEGIETARLLKNTLPLTIFAVQIGGTEKGYNNLIDLTGSKSNVEKTLPSQLLEALKRLSLCN